MAAVDKGLILAELERQAAFPPHPQPPCFPEPGSPHLHHHLQCPLRSCDTCQLCLERQLWEPQSVYGHSWGLLWGELGVVSKGTLVKESQEVSLKEQSGEGMLHSGGRNK